MIKRGMVVALLASQVVWAGGYEGNHSVNNSNVTNIVMYGGKDGAPGKDGSVDPLQVQVGGDIQWHEFDNRISLSSGYAYDAWNNSHIVRGLFVNYRLGESAAERENRRLRQKVDDLGMLLQKVAEKQSGAYFTLPNSAGGFISGEETQKALIKGRI